MRETIIENSFINRKTTKRSSANTMYKILYISCNGTVSDKSDLVDTLKVKGSNLINNKKVDNFKSKIGQKKADQLLTNNIFSVGIVGKDNDKLTNNSVEYADFLFFDFDNDVKSISNDKREKAIGKYITYDELKAILDDNNLNYILKTSYSHKQIDGIDGNKIEKLHLFLPLIKSIKNIYDYKNTYDVVYEKYFSEYEYDKSCRTWSKWCFAGNKKTLRFDYEFDKNDIKVIKSTSANKENERRVENGYKIEPYLEDEVDTLKIFSQLAENLYGFKLETISKNGVLKFYRDNNDKHPNVCYFNKDDKVIHDGANKYGLPYSFNNIKNAVRVNEIYKEKDNKLFEINGLSKNSNFNNMLSTVCDTITNREYFVQRLASTIQEVTQENGRRYVITNEGLGKSRSITKLAKHKPFIYLCHTNAKVNEAAENLSNEGIKNYKVIRSNYSILKDYEQELLDIGVEGLDRYYISLFESEKEIYFQQFMDLVLKYMKKKFNFNDEFVRKINIYIYTSTYVDTWYSEKWCTVSESESECLFVTDLDKKNYVNYNKAIQILDNIMQDRQENNLLFYDSSIVRIATIEKYKSIMIVESNMTISTRYYLHEQQERPLYPFHDLIVFDEFNINDWSDELIDIDMKGISAEHLKDNLLLRSIWSTKNEKFLLEKNKMNLLQLTDMCRNILILTTERKLIEKFFKKNKIDHLQDDTDDYLKYDKSFKEIKLYDVKRNIDTKDFNFVEEVRLDNKLYDDKVIYVFVSSTKKAIRADIVKVIQHKYEKKLDIKFNNIICDSLQKDELNEENIVRSHIGVKGVNNLIKNNTIVVGTSRTEVEDNKLYYSCNDYFEKFIEVYNIDTSKPSKLLENEIKQTMLEAQVHQSLGRNAGYRRSNEVETYTLVILPLLKYGSNKTFKSFDFNYITDKVFIEPLSY